MKVDFCIRNQNMKACENCGETPAPYSIMYRANGQTPLCRKCYYALAKILQSESIKENKYVTSFFQVDNKIRDEMKNKVSLLDTLMSGVYVPYPYNEENKENRKKLLDSLLAVKKELDELLVITSQIEEEFEKEGR